MFYLYIFTHYLQIFLRPPIDYGYIYHQPQNSSFCEKLDSAQCKATLAITGAIEGTSRKT